jgi:hypothetical protein
MIRFSEWLRDAEEARRRLEPIRRAFGEYRRERPRDSDKARLLRERGHARAPDRARAHRRQHGVTAT